MALNLGSQAVNGLYLGGTPINSCYLGSTQVFSSGPHLLEQALVIQDLQDGVLTSMTGDQNTRTVNGAFASKTAGTSTFAKKNTFAGVALADLPKTARVSALVKVVKTSGRFSYVGLSVENPTSSSTTAEVGHQAGTGIVVRSQNISAFMSTTIVEEALLTDGAWYLVTLAYDNVISGSAQPLARVLGGALNADGTMVAGFKPNAADRAVNSTTWPMRSLIARTNDNTGTIKDLTFVDNMMGIAPDNGFLTTYPYEGTGSDTTQRAYIYGRSQTAPLKVVLTAGGSGSYGGAQNWGATYGWNSAPYTGIRATWLELARRGFTVVNPTALHEGWGANDHLAAQIAVLDKLKAQYGSDLQLYYIAYSMGGASAWRAIMGRAGYPNIKAAYIVAGISQIDMFYDNPSYPDIKTRWPDRALIEDPATDYTGAELIARGTKVRMVTSTADANVPKATHHDPMAAKYGSSPLFSEVVQTSTTHFQDAYWNPTDIATFFESA